MSINSFDKNNRLLSTADFNHLKVESERVTRKYLRAYYKQSRHSSSKTRLGLSVSKAVGNAPKRSRVKRILREWFRASEHKNKGIDVIFIVSKYFNSGPRADLHTRERMLLDNFKEIFEEIPSI